MSLTPTAMDHFAELASILTDGVPVIGKASICVDSLGVSNMSEER